MGWFGDIFGGRDPKIMVESFLTPEQQGAFKEQLALAQQGVSGIPGEFTGGWPTFDETAPGPNRLQQLSLAGMEQLAAGGSGGTAAGGMVEQGRGAISDILGRAPTDFDEYFRTSVEDPLMDALNRPGSGLVSTLKKSQVGSGNLFGGEYQKGLGTLLEDTMDAMYRERSKMALDYRAQDTQDQLAAMGMIPMLEGVEPGILAGLMQSGEIGRMAEMDVYNSQLNEFMRQIEEAWRRRQYASGLATTQTTATMGDPGRQGVFETLLQSYAQTAGSEFGKTTTQFTPSQAMCWCAAVYYPYFTKDWFDCRLWITKGWGTPVGRLFYRLYRRYGERVSSVLRQSIVLRWMARPLFAWIRERGANYG